MTTTVTPSFTKAILTVLPTLGIHLPAPLLTGLQALPADQRLPMPLQEALWQAVEEQAVEEQATGAGIGLRIGSALQLANFDMVGFLLLSSPTLAEAAEALVSYSKLIGEGGSFSRERTARGWRLNYRADFQIARSIRLDAILTSILHGARWLVGQDLAPLQVGFEGEDDHCAERHRLFGAARLNFSQPLTYLEFSNSDWQRRLTSGSREVQQQMQRLAQQQLQRMAPQTMADKVSALLRRQPWLSRVQVAQLLAVSERHMNRRLAEQQLSFRMVADKVRMECALELLQERGATQESMASYLGYSDGSAFAKAFRRWTGMSMRTYLTRGLKRAEAGEE